MPKRLMFTHFVQKAIENIDEEMCYSAMIRDLIALTLPWTDKKL